LVVEAGKPVEFVFENNDLMPHNFVITQAGSMEEIGQLAEATALEPDAAQRHYVPKSDKILLASKLLFPRTVQKLPFNVPTKPGVYPYVCTYPGHWRRMYGALYVVTNLNDYFANPDAYLASANLPIQDELLKDRRPRTEWKLSEFAHLLTDHGLHGRSYATGKQMFTMASCVGCHRLENVGQQFGPELTKLDPKWKSLDILSHILDPSQKIEEKYKTYLFQMEDGKIVAGMIVEETDDVVKVIENPLTATDPKHLLKNEITARQQQSISPMPKGLLDKLSRDEILDLLAYVIAAGDKNHATFKNDHPHEHNHSEHQHH
jgi:putative heme-binding domain-containing protein